MAEKDSKAPKKPPVVRQGPAWALAATAEKTGKTEKPTRPKLEDVVPADALAKMTATNKRSDRTRSKERNPAAKKRAPGKENIDPM